MMEERYTNFKNVIFVIMDEKGGDFEKVYLPILLKFDFFNLLCSVSIFDLLISFKELSLKFFIGELL